MTTFNDLDFGPSHAWLKTRVGQVAGTALIEGSRTAVWPRGRLPEEQPVDLYVSPWQGLGGNAAGTRASLLYLLRQLEELAGNSDLQPVYIGWTTTAAPGAFSAADLHDGWYVVTIAQPNYRRYVVTGGVVTVPVAVSLVAPASPASLALWWSGALLPTTYTGGTPAGGVILGAYPVGSTAPAPALSRTGAEGVVPLTIAAASPAPVDPLPFVRPATVAGLWPGGCRVLDTINTGSNPIPTAGAFLNANWVQVYGTHHDFQGDAVVTNGLLLLLFQTGQPGVQIWLWNTKLGTPAWQQAGTVRYLDTNSNVGTLREVNLERVGWEHVRVRARLSTSAGQWAQQVWRLSRGHYDAPFEFWPLTQPNTGASAVDLQLATAAKIVYNDAALYDMVNGPASLAVPTTFGHVTVFGQTANGPLIGLLYQQPPSANQPAAVSTTEIGSGDSSGPAQGSFRLYGVFAVPFTTAPNLQAEAESGSLPAGWTSGGNVNASGGFEAKCASGTLAAVRNLFGTAWQPQPQNGGSADVWVRLRVTTNVGSALEFKAGLWDVVAGAYVAGASAIFNRTAIPTGYGTTNWFRVTSPGGCVLPIGHNLQFAAEPALTLGTDWFVDEAVLLPRSSASVGNVGSGDWPADLWAQFMQPLTTEWAPG